MTSQKLIFGSSLGDETVHSGAVELLGILAGNLTLPLSLKGAEDFLGKHFQLFLKEYARYDLAGILVASSDRTSVKQLQKERVLPEYLPYLRLGLTARLDYLDSHSADINFTDKKVAQIISDPFIDKEIKWISDNSRGSPRQDFYLSSVCEELFNIYGNAWKSGPIHVHSHGNRNGPLKEVYHLSTFKDPNSDDHETMNLVVRALSGGFSNGFSSWEGLETAIYEGLCKVTNFDHHLVKGVELKLCTGRCEYYKKMRRLK